MYKRKPKRHILMEEDSCSSDSEDYMGVTFQKQALEIREPPEGFDPQTTPQDGEHYLMQMAYERKRIPAIVVKRPRKLNDAPVVQLDEPKDEPIAVPPFGLPTEEWKELQVRDFLALRAKINHLRSFLDAQNYDQSLEIPLTKEPQKWQAFCQQHQPVLSVIMRIRQRDLENLLEILAEYLRERTDGPDVEENDDNDDDNDVGPADAVQELAVKVSAPGESCDEMTVPDLMVAEKWLGLWLYATLACLQLPLEGHVHFSLRLIARLCVKQRERLQHDDNDEQKAIPYNMLICFIARVFRQLDFMDYV